MENISSEDSNSPEIKQIRKSFMEYLGTLLTSGDFSDVKIVVQGNQINAHKCMLARSKVFKAAFVNDFEEKTQNLIKIDDFEHNVVMGMLHYIYTGKSPELSQIAGPLLVAADKYDLQGLKYMCERKLVCQLDSDNAADSLFLADTYNAEQLKVSTMMFIKEHSSAVYLTGGWERLKRVGSSKVLGELCEILGSPPKRRKL